jgi:hypothetical protein
LYSASWDLQSDLFQKKAHYKFKPTQGDVMNERGVISSGLAWVMNLPKGVEVKSIHDAYYELTMNDVPPFFEEDHMLPAEPLKYNVNFFYRWTVHQDDYWKDEGKYWSKQAEKFLSKSGGVHEALAGLIQPGDSAEQKSRKIYAFVHRTRTESLRPGEEHRRGGRSETEARVARRDHPTLRRDVSRSQHPCIPDVGDEPKYHALQPNASQHLPTR